MMKTLRTLWAVVLALVLGLAVQAQQQVNNFRVLTNLYVGNAITAQTLNGYNIDAIATNSAGSKIAITNGTAFGLYQVPFSTLRVFGDSTSNEADEWAEVLADDWGLTTENFAVSGYYLIQMMDRAFTNTVATNLTTAIQCCVNDSRETSGTRINTWSNAVPAAIAFHAIPDSRKLWANNANVAYTGTWTTDALWSGVGRVSTVNGSTVTFTNYGTVVYIATRQTNSGGAGTYTVTIDGVSQGTFDAGGAAYGSSAGASPRLLRFGGLSEALHVTTITVTSSTSSANPVWFDWSAGNLGHNTDYGPRVYFSNTTRRTAASYSGIGGSEATVEQQNETIRYFVNLLAGDGLNVTLMEFGAALDPVNTADGTHPNSTGTRQMVNAAKAAMLGNLQPRYQPIASATASGSGGSQTPWTSNIDADGYNLTGAGSVESGVFASSATPAASGTIRLGATDSIVAKGVTATDYTLWEFTGDNIMFAPNGALYVVPSSRVDMRPNGTAVASFRSDGNSWLQALYVGPGLTKTNATAQTRTISTPVASGSNIPGDFLSIDVGSPTGNADGGEFRVNTVRDGGTSGSTARNTTRSLTVTKNGNALMYPGTADTAIKLGGSFSSNITPTGNNAGSETDLMTYTVPGAVTISSGDTVIFEAWGYFAGNTNAKRVIVYFGGVAIFDTGSIAFNDGDWHVRAAITRTGSTTARAITVWTSSNANLPHYVAKSLSLTPTWSSSQVVKVTGNGTSANDVLAAFANWSLRMN